MGSLHQQQPSLSAAMDVNLDAPVQEYNYYQHLFLRAAYTHPSPCDSALQLLHYSGTTAVSLNHCILTFYHQQQMLNYSASTDLSLENHIRLYHERRQLLNWSALIKGSLNYHAQVFRAHHQLLISNNTISGPDTANASFNSSNANVSNTETVDAREGTVLAGNSHTPNLANSGPAHGHPSTSSTPDMDSAQTPNHTLDTLTSGPTPPSPSISTASCAALTPGSSIIEPADDGEQNFEAPIGAERRDSAFLRAILGFSTAHLDVSCFRGCSVIPGTPIMDCFIVGVDYKYSMEDDKLTSFRMGLSLLDTRELHARVTNHNEARPWDELIETYEIALRSPRESARALCEIAEDTTIHSVQEILDKLKRDFQTGRTVICDDTAHLARAIHCLMGQRKFVIITERSKPGIESLHDLGINLGVKPVCTVDMSSIARCLLHCGSLDYRQLYMLLMEKDPGYCTPGGASNLVLRNAIYLQSNLEHLWTGNSFENALKTIAKCPNLPAHATSGKWDDFQSIMNIRIALMNGRWERLRA
jgi:hypothetical protein